ncbi:MAG: peptidylprolyl isomerase [Nanoarchaeota archaeon]
MAEVVKEQDFVEIDYTGKLADGTVFDTTSEKVAKDNKLYFTERKYGPAIICVGEKQILPGLDSALLNKELGNEYAVTLPPEKAFGKRDIKLIKIIPMNTFHEHKIQPQPGLQVDIDDQRGIITNISGGRIIVNFNHPLAGKEVTYVFTVHRKITDQKEKVTSFLSSLLRMPADKMKIEIKDNAAAVTMPGELPAQISTILAQKLMGLTGLKDIVFKKEEIKKEDPEK